MSFRMSRIGLNIIYNIIYNVRCYLILEMMFEKVRVVLYSKTSCIMGLLSLRQFIVFFFFFLVRRKGIWLPRFNLQEYLKAHVMCFGEEIHSVSLLQDRTETSVKQPRSTAVTADEELTTLTAGENHSDCFQESEYVTDKCGIYVVL